MYRRHSRFENPPLREESVQKKIKRNASRNVQCMICMETFSQSFTLKEHMRVHTGDKPHNCSICQKTFRHTTNLQRHAEIHTLSKHFDCGLCEKTFRRKAHLIKHQKTIHKVQISTDSKTAKISQTVCCKKCGKKCKSMKDMRKHWAWHCYAQSSLQNTIVDTGSTTALMTKYYCESCRETFLNKFEYELHTKTQIERDWQE